VIEIYEDIKSADARFNELLSDEEAFPQLLNETISNNETGRRIKLQRRKKQNGR
jgi:uncharacterized protein YdcH (DUF465 family)